MDASKSNHDSRNNGWFFLLSFIIFLAPWFLTVRLLYVFPKNRNLEGYYYSFLSTPKNGWLIASILLGIFFAVLTYISLKKITKTNFEGAAYIKRLRGVQMVNATHLCKLTKENGIAQIEFCGVPVPSNIENLHFAIGGSTGSGKSVAISAFLESSQKRAKFNKKDRIICVDPNGGFLRHFYKDGDIILNPFDARGAGWSIFNEIKTRFDVEQFSVSMIPKSASTEQESFNSMARVLVSETMIKIWEKADEDTDFNAELFYWLITAPNELFFEFLDQTPAQGLFGASETYGSIKAVLTQYIKPHKYLTNGSFSIRSYLENPAAGNLWITWKQDQLAALKPLISCWIDTICASILSMSDVQGKQSFLMILDELDSLEKLNYIVDALTKGRKHGLVVVGGFQSFAQLDNTYGKDEAMTLRNSFSSNAVCQIASGDTYSSEQYSQIFGKHEVTRYQDNLSFGTAIIDTKGSRQVVKETESVIMASQINALKPLEFFMRFAQSNYVCKTKLPYVNRPFVTDGYVQIENEWTNKKN